MWVCAKCGAAVHRSVLKGSTEVCSKCGTPKPSTERWGADLSEPSSSGFRVGFKHFRGTWGTWEELFLQASAYASEVGPERLISISHSEDGNDGVVTVLYWMED